MQFGDKRSGKIDAAAWGVLHLKAIAYVRCFIDMSLYNNFGGVLWKKIEVMFENKNVVNKVSVLKKGVRLW